jgi:hypothetical protein
MRRIAIIMAGAALALSLVVPAVASGVAQAGGRHGHHDSHGYYRHGHGGSCYGCFGPGSRCGRYGCDYAFLYPGYGYYGVGGYGYPYGYGGYWWGGFGCGFDYPCGPPFDEKCRAFRGSPSPDPRCVAERNTKPAPGQGAQPAPAPGQPAPDQGAQPAPPDQGAQPAPPDQGGQPTPSPGQGQPTPRPY